MGGGYNCPDHEKGYIDLRITDKNWIFLVWVPLSGPSENLDIVKSVTQTQLNPIVKELLSNFDAIYVHEAYF